MNMTSKRFLSLAAKTVPVMAVALAVVVISANCLAENVILRLNQTLGAHPTGGLISDGAGNLYGTASEGGHTHLCLPRGCGVVFKLSPVSGGGWIQTVLYAFKGANDGGSPTGALVFDSQGNLYGTAFLGSASSGVVFKLTPASGGVWTETVIYRFSGTDGHPNSGALIFDAAGNLYGTTSNGGTYSLGDVFELSPQSDGSWKETILHSFNPNNGDGTVPLAGVVMDTNGNLFGTTIQGGGSGVDGTVFELTPQGNGTWSESLIYLFKTNGNFFSPRTPLTIDSSGNLFGTTFSKVFELSPGPSGTWTVSVLHDFLLSPSDGLNPSGLVFDGKGNLYGATQSGGNGCNAPGCGIVFRLTPQSGGTWKETILHQFQSAFDGSQPAGGVLVDSVAGRVYGATSYGGGRYGYGTVFAMNR